MRNMKKIIKILIIITILFLFIGAVSATRTEYGPVKGKVKAPNTVAKQGENKKIIVQIKDNFNYPVKNHKIKITQNHNGNIHSEYKYTNNKGQYIDNTRNYKIGKTKVTIKSTTSYYPVFEGKYTVTILPPKYITKTCTIKWNYDTHKKYLGNGYITTGHDDKKGTFFLKLNSPNYKLKKIVLKFYLYTYVMNAPIYTKTFKIHNNKLSLNCCIYKPITAKVYYLKPTKI